MPPATRIPHQCRGGIHAARDPHPARMPGPACHAGRVPRPPKEALLLMVPGAIASRLPLAPGTATTGAGWWARRGGAGARVGAWMPAAPGTAGGNAWCRRGRTSPCAPRVGAAFMPPAIRIPHGCPARHSCRPRPASHTDARPGIHAARDSHPAPMPGRPWDATGVRHPAPRGASYMPNGNGE